MTSRRTRRQRACRASAASAAAVAALALSGCAQFEVPALTPEETPTEAGPSASIDPREPTTATLGEYSVTVPAKSTIDGGDVTLQPAARGPALGPVAGMDFPGGVAVSLTAGTLVRPLTVTWETTPPEDPAAIPLVAWQGEDGSVALLSPKVTDGDDAEISVSTEVLTQGWFGWLTPDALTDEALERLKDGFLEKSYVHQPRCPNVEAANDGLDQASDSGDPVLWCAGMDGSLAELMIGNNRGSLVQVALPAGWAVGELESVISVLQLKDILGDGADPLVTRAPRNLNVVLVAPAQTISATSPSKLTEPVEVRTRSSVLSAVIEVTSQALGTYASVTSALGLEQSWAADSTALLRGDRSVAPEAVRTAWAQCLGSIPEELAADPWRSPEPEQVEQIVAYANGCFEDIARAGIEAEFGPAGTSNEVSSGVAGVVAEAYSRLTERTSGVADLHERIMAVGGSSRLIYGITVGPKTSDEELDSD